MMTSFFHPFKKVCRTVQFLCGVQLIILLLLLMESPPGSEGVSVVSDTLNFIGNRYTNFLQGGLNTTATNEVMSDRISKRSIGNFYGRQNKRGNVDTAAIHLTAPELIKSRGYNLEIHKIFTTDGYILEAHRIPAPGKPVVFAFHGMFQSSRDFLMNSDHKAFAYKMADAGFDVWLGNARGNFYSKAHSFLNVNSGAYWNYSVDEIIYYDIPASIDYVIAVTGQPKINWVGYSLGTAVIFGVMSVHPEYNDKINLFISLGTTAYVGHTRSPVLRILAPLNHVQDVIVTALNHGEYLPSFLFPIMRFLFPIICYPEASINLVGLCSSFLFIIAGFNPSQANPAILPVMLGGTPSSISVKMLSQWYQWINKGKFSYYDFGKQGNLDHYNSQTPPSYNLSRVTCKTANFYALNDWLSPPEDVLRVVSELPNVVANIKVDLDSFNHLDFLYAKDADFYVYNRIIDVLRIYT